MATEKIQITFKNALVHLNLREKIFTFASAKGRVYQEDIDWEYKESKEKLNVHA